MEIMEEISSNGLMAATLKDCHLENYEVQQISAYICEWVGGFVQPISLLAEKTASLFHSLALDVCFCHIRVLLVF